MLEKDLLLGGTQWCLICDEVKPLEQGEAVVRYGSFIEFTCYECKGQTSTERKTNELTEEISNAIYRVFPNFDNNIEKETWDLMVLSVEEICNQLGKENK